MKRKGFTLVELLVVISIIALLMAILMPVLAKVKAIANQMVCGTNLSGIGKGMMLYAGDYDDQYPIAGGRQPIWAGGGAITEPFPAPTIPVPQPYGTAATGNPATITASFFLLVKFADMGPEQFVCKGDTGTTKFKLSDYGLGNYEITDAWDFGRGAGVTDRPAAHCSYSYHMPYAATAPTNPSFPISPASNPGSPLCADRTPYADKNARSYCPTGVPPGSPPSGSTDGVPSWQTTPAPPHYYDRFKAGNAACHQRNGQNVLYNDIHVTFERYPNVGINQDNIWIYWTGTPGTAAQPAQPQDYQVNGGGTSGRISSASPRSEKDALLCSESTIP